MLSGATMQVVFIHGIFGSHLHTVTEGNPASQITNPLLRARGWQPRVQHYLSKPQGMGISGSDVSLPLLWSHSEEYSKASSEALASETRSEQYDANFTRQQHGLNVTAPYQAYGADPLVATDIIESVGPVDVYAPILNYCRGAFGEAAVHSFAYDWRRDGNENVDLFIKYLEVITGQHSGVPPMVIAHSNGGIITNAAVNERPELFHSVVFAAPALGPGPGFLWDLQYGALTQGGALGCAGRGCTGRVVRRVEGVEEGEGARGAGRAVGREEGRGGGRRRGRKGGRTGEGAGEQGEKEREEVVEGGGGLSLTGS